MCLFNLELVSLIRRKLYLIRWDNAHPSQQAVANTTHHALSEVGLWHAMRAQSGKLVCNY